MRFNDIANTCSMVELTLASSNEIADRERFLSNIRNHFEDDNSSDVEPGDKDWDEDNDTLTGIKCILYNCQNRNWEPHLHKLGFRKKNSYIGNNVGPNGNKVRINVWMLNVTKKLRKEINKYR